MILIKYENLPYKSRNVSHVFLSNSDNTHELPVSTVNRRSAFTASSSRISKRGSKRLRRALYVAVQCGLRKGINERLKAYYDKKRQEGKPYKVTVIACANKLLHHIYAILKKGQPYHA
jgi:transposase